MSSIITSEQIQKKIHYIRGQKVMLDLDLAHLYSVPTKSLNLAVRRNGSRFPSDFMFQITEEEFENLRFQIETSSWGGRRYMPFVFTEQGVAMLSSVLKSKRAVIVNIAIMRTFVKLRELLATHKELARKLEVLETRLSKHDNKFKKQGTDIRKAFKAIWLLMNQKKPIGFGKRETA